MSMTNEYAAKKLVVNSLKHICDYVTSCVVFLGGRCKFCGHLSAQNALGLGCTRCNNVSPERCCRFCNYPLVCPIRVLDSTRYCASHVAICNRCP